MNLRDFLVAFEQLMQDLEPHSDGMMGTRWTPKSGRRAHAERLISELARLAGPAAEAFDARGVYIDYKPPGTWQTPGQSTRPWYGPQSSMIRCSSHT